jgi:hypothetical protein
MLVIFGDRLGDHRNAVIRVADAIFAYPLALHRLGGRHGLVICCVGGAGQRRTRQYCILPLLVLVLVQIEHAALLRRLRRLTCTSSYPTSVTLVVLWVPGVAHRDHGPRAKRFRESPPALVHWRHRNRAAAEQPRPVDARPCNKRRSHWSWHTPTRNLA